MTLQNGAISKRAQAIIDRLVLRQERLVKQHREHGPEFFFYPSWDRASAASAEAAIASGQIKPAGDGLLGGVSSQTWGA